MTSNASASPSKEPIPVAILGATGAVGQRFISLLEDHPWFQVAVVTASERSEGKSYAQATHWVIPGEMPQSVRHLILQPTDKPGSAHLVFSALPTDIAREVEPKLAGQGYAVCSNASALRMEENVPLLIPEINPDHLALIPHQQSQRGWDGFVVTSPNCSTTGIVFPLHALHEAFGVTQVHAVTMQAISGAGYPGVSSFDILDNIIPYIPGEEGKIERETRKLLGVLAGDCIQPAQLIVSAQVHRVPVSDGHLAAMTISLDHEASQEQVQATLSSFQAPEEIRQLPSSPQHVIVHRTELDRPQPRRDRETEHGMAVTVGRVQPCPVMSYKLISLVHNTLRGAAGGAILNAELLLQRGFLGK